MARVRDIEIDEVPEDARDTYRRFATQYGPFLNQVKVFAHRPPALRHIMGLLLELSDEQILPKRYLEIALVVVSKIPTTSNSSSASVRCEPTPSLTIGAQVIGCGRTTSRRRRRWASRHFLAGG